MKHGQTELVHGRMLETRANLKPEHAAVHAPLFDTDESLDPRTKNMCNRHIVPHTLPYISHHITSFDEPQKKSKKGEIHFKEEIVGWTIENP